MAFALEMVVDILISIFKLVLVLGSTAAIVWFSLRTKKYDTKTFEIDIDFDTRQINGIRMGKGGTYVDNKTQNKRFFIKKGNVGLNPDKVPYINIINNGVLEPKQGVLLIKSGLKNYRFLRPKVNLDKKVSFLVGEEDVNWAINAYERQKKVFGLSLWDKLLPYLPLIIVAFAMVVMLVVIMKNSGQMIEILQLMKETSANTAQAKMGTVIS